MPYIIDLTREENYKTDSTNTYMHIYLKGDRSLVTLIEVQPYTNGLCRLISRYTLYIYTTYNLKMCKDMKCM